MNYVPQAGGGWEDSHSCDTMYEGVNKTMNLVWQREKGFRKFQNLCDVINGFGSKNHRLGKLKES